MLPVLSRSHFQHSNHGERGYAIALSIIVHCITLYSPFADLAGDTVNAQMFELPSKAYLTTLDRGDVVPNIIIRT